MEAAPKHLELAPAAFEAVVAPARRPGGNRHRPYLPALLAVAMLTAGEVSLCSPASRRAEASSSAPGHAASAAVDGSLETTWLPAGPGPAWLALDLDERCAYGGLVLTWVRSGAGLDYEVQASDDGSAWATLRRVVDAGNGPDFVPLPGGSSRWLRISLPADRAAPAGLAEIEVMPPAFGASAGAVYAEMARRAPRGRFPRAFLGEQGYWTVVGADGSPQRGRLAEDGALEADGGAFTIEPFVRLGDELVSWSGVDVSQSLADDYLPVPTVTWLHPRFTLAVTAVAAGGAAPSSLLVRYAVRNLANEPLKATVYLAVRPLLVGPPPRRDDGAGGVARLTDIALDGDEVVVDGGCRLSTWPAPSGFGAATFDQGDITRYLAAGSLPVAAAVHDPEGHAGAALAFAIEVPPGERWAAVMESSFPGAHPSRLREGRDGDAVFDETLERARQLWRERLNRVALSLPPGGKALADTLRSNLAYILVDRAGVRDGALVGTALLRLAHYDAVRELVDHWAGIELADGRVPCPAGADGVDPTPGRQCDGELLYLIGEYYLVTGDRGTVEAHWDGVARAVGYLDALRQRSRTAADRAPDTLPFFGLLPASNGSEGSATAAVHAYRDDFWALRGLASAASLADALGHRAEAERFAASHGELHADVLASLSSVIAQHRIDYVPGNAELADFDPAATALAVEPGRELKVAPPGLLDRTFERCWQDSVARQNGAAVWDAYSARELLVAGGLVRLGRRDRAMALLDALMGGRRPSAWNQWAAVVGRDPRRPRPVGDMPDTSAGADFIVSFLDVLAYEREGDQALVIGAGLPRPWIDDPEGVVVEGLRTRWGPLSYRARSAGGAIIVDIGGATSMPPGGVELVLPLSRPPRRVTVDGHRVNPRAPLVVRSLPAHVEVLP
jgi:hypothetical protein